MNTNRLPKRTAQSPLLRWAIFEDKSYINLIRLYKPYADGFEYVIAESTPIDLGLKGKYKNFEEAISDFRDAVDDYKKASKITNTGITGNAERIYR